MSMLMGLEVLAVVAPRIAKPPTTPVEGVNPIMVFGFFATFITLIVLMYQHKMRTRIPLLMICLVALSVEGFLEGTWTLGFSLAALSASEFARWYHKKPRRFSNRRDTEMHTATLYDSESRVARMFGSP